MSNNTDLSTVCSIDRALASTIRKLAWLQDRRDAMIGITHRGPRCPKGPVLRGEVDLQRRMLSATETTIVDTCKTYPHEQWSTHDILNETEINKNSLACAITRLVRDGYLHRVTRGMYKLNPELAQDD